MGKINPIGILLNCLCSISGGLLLVACTAKAPIETLPPSTPEPNPAEKASEQAPERLVIDLREPGPFAAGHLPGALNIQLGWDQLRGRMGAYVPDRTQPLALRANSQSEAEQAAAILLDLGYQDFARITPAPSEETATLPLMSAAELAKQLKAPLAPIVLDIRTPDEFAEGVIKGAVLIDEDHGPEALKGLDPKGHYAIICAGGWRSSQLATYMRNHGFTDVTNVIDGMSAWQD